MKPRLLFHGSRLAIIVACMGLLVMPVTSRAVPDAPELPAGVVTELPDLVLAGAGKFSVMFWDIYTAALWVPNGGYSSDQPHVLALRYAREFDGGDIAERSIREIRDLGFGSSEQHDAWLENMREVFPDVEKGDQLTGVHVPGEKAVFYRNNQRIGEITDADFAHAFFAIWLDEKTAAPDLRRQLLGMNTREASLTIARQPVSAGVAAPAGSI